MSVCLNVAHAAQLCIFPPWPAPASLHVDRFLLSSPHFIASFPLYTPSSDPSCPSCQAITLIRRRASRIMAAATAPSGGLSQRSSSTLLLAALGPGASSTASSAIPTPPSSRRPCPAASSTTSLLPRILPTLASLVYNRGSGSGYNIKVKIYFQF